MTSKKNPEALNDADLDQTSGGPAYLKLGDIDGESKNSFDLVGKRTAATRSLPAEEVTLGYTKVEWTY